MAMTANTRILVQSTTVAGAITVVTLVLLWVLESLPSICPAIYPAPPSCAADARLGPAIWGSMAVVALFIATIVVGMLITPAKRSRTQSIMVFALVVVAVIAMLVTLGSSGFEVTL
jgi:small-conductance mechanosensitive channel